MTRSALIPIFMIRFAAAALPQPSDHGSHPPAYSTTNPAPASADARETRSAPDLFVPPDVFSALADVKDYQLTFEGPGFEALLDFVKRNGVSRAAIDAAPFFDDWRSLFERPSSLRGSAVTIEGVVGRNKSWSYADPARKTRFGDVWQLEISQPAQPLAATIILTRDASDVGIHSTIRVTGYFLAVRHYLTSKNEVRPALLIVAEGPTRISRSAPPQERESRFSVHWAFVAAIAALVAAWVLIRWTGRGGRTDLHTLRSTHSAPADLSHDLEQWASRDDDQR